MVWGNEGGDGAASAWQSVTAPPRFSLRPSIPPPPKIDHHALNHGARPPTADGRRHTAPTARKRDGGAAMWAAAAACGLSPNHPTGRAASATTRPGAMAVAVAGIPPRGAVAPPGPRNAPAAGPMAGRQRGRRPGARQGLSAAPRAAAPAWVLARGRAAAATLAAAAAVTPAARCGSAWRIGTRGRSAGWVGGRFNCGTRRSRPRPAKAQGASTPPSFGYDHLRLRLEGPRWPGMEVATGPAGRSWWATYNAQILR